LADALGDQLLQKRVRAEWLTEPELDSGVTLPQPVPRGRQVAPEMDTRGEEVRDHQDTSCASGDAAVSALIDVGVGELQETRFDDRIAGARGEPLGDLVQVAVGGRVAAPVSDQQNGRSIRSSRHQYASPAPAK
jgi:hypothetical protein